MECLTRVGLFIVLGVCILTGCGESGSNVETTSRPNGSAAAPATPAGTEVIAEAAADFLDAILKGDTQRASARLTPQAIERIIASGIQFQPQGLKTAVFRIGEIRTPSQNQAIVQCVLTDTSTDGKQESEEMCCLMRHVEEDWRVSGIAYGRGANQPWTLSDFETGQTTTIARQPSPASMGQPATAPAARPSPPRTATETAPATTVR
jgi:hypothetical protein